MYPNPYGNQQPGQGQGIGFIPPTTSAPPHPNQGQGPAYPPPYPQGSSPYPPTGYPTPQYAPSPYYPQQQQQAYPQQATGYPSAQPGYPPQQPTGYPSAQPGYPPQQPTGYPSAQPGYPPQQPTGYPSAQTGYPPQQPTAGYPSAQPGYPPQQPTGYPQQDQGYLQQNTYPGQAHGQPVLVAEHQTHQSSAPSLNAGMQYQDVPTLRNGPCDPSADAQLLRKAMKGFGTDENAIINCLGKRTDSQRQQIAQAFKASFGKDLIKDLKSELGGRLEEVVLALMTPRYDLLAETLKRAMSGLGTKEKRLVDVLCTATNNDIRMIQSSYQRLYGKSLEKEIRGDTSGHFQRLLVSILAAGRSEEQVANPTIAQEDAQKLLQAGEKKWGTDESCFNMILATRSYAQLRLMFHEYERLTGRSFEKVVESEFSGDVGTGMKAVVKSAKNRAGYFAERIHESVAGLGTKDDDLIFLIVSRADVDLESIKQEYMKMYGKSLADDVGGDVGGDYKKILLALLGM